MLKKRRRMAMMPRTTTVQKRMLVWLLSLARRRRSRRLVETTGLRRLRGGAEVTPGVLTEVRMRGPARIEPRSSARSEMAK